MDEFRAIVAFRHFIVHHYWSIDDEAVWEIIQQDVEPLRQAVAAMLEEFT